MPFLPGRRRVRGPGLQGGRLPCCRPGALTGRCERVSARMKAATLSPLGGFGAIIPPPNGRNGARATRKRPLWSGVGRRKPRGHGNGWPPNGTWAVGPAFPSSSARKKPKVQIVRTDTGTDGKQAGARRLRRFSVRQHTGQSNRLNGSYVEAT